MLSFADTLTRIEQDLLALPLQAEMQELKQLLLDLMKCHLRKDAQEACIAFSKLLEYYNDNCKSTGLNNEIYPLLKICLPYFPQTIENPFKNQLLILQKEQTKLLPPELLFYFTTQRRASVEKAPVMSGREPYRSMPRQNS